MKRNLHFTGLLRSGFKRQQIPDALQGSLR